MIPIFISSNPLTGRTDRLHIFQMLVPSHRAQVCIQSCFPTCSKSDPTGHRPANLLPNRQLPTGKEAAARVCTKYYISTSYLAAVLHAISYKIVPCCVRSVGQLAANHNMPVVHFDYESPCVSIVQSTDPFSWSCSQSGRVSCSERTLTRHLAEGFNACRPLKKQRRKSVPRAYVIFQIP